MRLGTPQWTMWTGSKHVGLALQVDSVNCLSMCWLDFYSPTTTDLEQSHGIDSLNCTLASLCETAAMGLGSSKSGVFTALVPCLPMFFSTWETYHTHTLYLGYFNGPTGLSIVSITGYGLCLLS
jgi:hypothetical protein